MGYQHVQPWQPLETGKYFDIKTGEHTLDGDSDNITIAAIDVTKAVLEFSYTCDSSINSCIRQMVKGEIVDSTTINFSRFGTAGECVIRWFIWEAKPSTPMTVQTFSEEAGSSNSLPRNESITAVDLDHSFLTVSYKANTADAPGKATCVRCAFTSSTNVETDMNTINAASIPTWTQVVEHLDWDVQSGQKVFSGFTDSAALSPAIALADSYIVSSGEFEETILNGDEVAKVWQNTTTTINFDRIDDSSYWTIDWFAVDTNGDFNTQIDDQSISSGNTYETKTKTATNINRTFLKLNTPILAFGNPDSGDSFGEIQCIKLALGDNLEADKDTDQTAFRISNASLDTELKASRHEITAA